MLYHPAEIADEPELIMTTTTHESGRNYGALLDWSLTSDDYIRHRPGYPDDYFHHLQHFGIGLAGQQILDLGAGTGNLSIPFARQGAYVTAVDLSQGQIDAARERAEGEKLSLRFIISGAEDAPVEEAHFDAVSASMCWGYFDTSRIVDKVRKVLRPDGLLMISSIIWLSNDNDITRRTEEIVARHNEHFTTRGSIRDSPVIPDWSANTFQLKTYHQYIAPLTFTRESWRGRLRASKWIGAALSLEKAEAFDIELAEVLEIIAPEQFEINHTIRIQVFQVSA